MTSQQNSLSAALQAAGWEVVARTIDLPWWADEVWTIASTWRPVGLQVFLAFLIDPMCYSANRRRGEHVDSVRCTPTWPELDRREDEIANVALNHWDKKLVQLIECLARFRDQAA